MQPVEIFFEENNYININVELSVGAIVLYFVELALIALKCNTSYMYTFSCNKWF